MYHVCDVKMCASHTRTGDTHEGRRYLSLQNESRVRPISRFQFFNPFIRTIYRGFSRQSCPVAMRSQKSLSCSTKRIVGLLSSSSVSIWPRESRSI